MANTNESDKAMLTEDFGPVLQDPVDEQKAAQEASHRMIRPFQKGDVIPEDFVNPPHDAMGDHYCVDPGGRYRPDWYALKLHKFDDRMPSRQFFNVNGKKYFVRVGVWLDVPQDVITALRDCEVETVVMDYDGTDLVTNDFVPMTVDRTPRFAYTVFKSA